MTAPRICANANRHPRRGLRYLVAAAALVLAWLAFQRHDVSAPEAATPVIAARNAASMPAPVIEPPAASRQAVSIAAAPVAQFLSGRVLFADTRTPVPTASILVRDFANPTPGDDASIRVWHSTGDSMGRFRLEVGDAKVVDMEVDGPGCVRRRLPVVAVASDVEILLTRGWRLIVEVRQPTAAAPEALEPVRGASCRLVLRGDNARRRCFVDGVTDQQGEIAFNVNGPHVHLVIERPGVPTDGGIFDITQGQERLRVVLAATGEVSGRVVDKHSGLPIGGATLSAAYRTEVRTVSDGDGMFRLPHRREDGELWRVEKPGYATLFQRVFPQATLPARIPDVELEATATLIGSVSGFDGDVRVTAISETVWFGHQRWTRAVGPAPDGAVRVGEVPPREAIVVSARDRSGHAGCARVPAAQPGHSLDFGVLRPQPRATVYGTVRGFDPGAPVVVRVEVQQGEATIDDVTQVVDRGEYRVAGLSPGSAHVQAMQGDVRSRRTEVMLAAGSNQPLDVDLGPTITGVVLDESGAGILGLVVAASDTAGPLRGTEGARTDETGRFVCVPSHADVLQEVQVWNPYRDRVVEPDKVERVVPGGPPLRFLLRNASLTFRGSVDAATIEAIGVRRLRIEARDAAGHRFSSAVEADGNFVIAVQDIGPHMIEVLAIDESGAELGVDRVPQVEPLRDVHPGGEAIVLHWSKKR